MNYRKKFQDEYFSKTGKLMPKEYEVHHIDANRDNNNYDNLIGLPKQLHKILHSRIGLIPKIPLENLIQLYEKTNKNFTNEALVYWIKKRLENVGLSEEIQKKNTKLIAKRRIKFYQIYLQNRKFKE
jgi:hypothetical protein